MSKQTIPTFSPDADLENADWTKQSWDWPPYKSSEFLEAIGGPENLDSFRRLPAYRAAVDAGIIHDDEWVLDWAQPARPAEPDPAPGSPRRDIHVHIHRRPT